MENSGKLANRGWLHRGFVSGTNRRGSGCREEKGRKRGGGACGRSERERRVDKGSMEIERGGEMEESGDGKEEGREVT